MSELYKTITDSKSRMLILTEFVEERVMEEWEKLGRYDASGFLKELRTGEGSEYEKDIVELKKRVGISPELGS